MSCARNVLRSALFAALLPLAAVPGALALDRNGYSVEVLVDGRPLEEYQARGTTYIEAQRGREYSLRLTNHTGTRIAVALSVDGLNTIDAKTTPARKASKWVLGPYQTVTLDGWQVNSDAARRFFFTTEDKSYGAWLGRTKNLGLIAAVVFRERRPPPQVFEKDAPPSLGRERNDVGSAGAPSGQGVPRGQAVPHGQAAPSSKAEVRALADHLAATGIGRRLDHPVEDVALDLEEYSAASLEMRYEYHDALVKLGVLPRPESRDDDALARRERARGFGDGFCPDPYTNRGR